LEVFRAGTARARLDLHDGARYLISGLRSLIPDELTSLPEPPKELDNPRVSLYVGWQCIDVLAEVSHRTQLSASSVIRRLVHGLLISGSIEFVQKNGIRELHLVRVQKNSENVCSQS
jgi:hypothetical protein